MSNNIRNICLLIDSRTYGGIETHVCHLAKELIALKHNVNITLVTDHGFHPVFDQHKVTQKIVNRPVSGLMSLVAMFKNGETDVIHTHGYKAGILGRVIGGLYKIPVVSTFHAGEKGNTKLQFYAWLDRFTSLFSVRIGVSDEIARFVGPNTRTIQNFVEIPDGSNMAGNSKKKIAFVGRFSEEKGPDTFCKIAMNIPELQFCMYGDGPLFKTINKTKPDNLSLFGHVDTMDEHWHDVKVLCITSRAEGLPLAALEALSRGIPVISFDIGGLSTVVVDGKTGWIITPFDVHAFIQKINDVSQLSVSSFNKIAAQSKTLIEHQFSSKAVVPLIMDCYDQAILGGSNA